MIVVALFVLMVVEFAIILALMQSYRDVAADNRELGEICHYLLDENKKLREEVK